MNLASLIAIIQALAPLVSAAFPLIEQEVQTILSLVTSKTDLTPDQQAQIDQALDSMHQKLQAQVQADTATSSAPSAGAATVVQSPEAP